jgi:hypothetical protein
MFLLCSCSAVKLSDVHTAQTHISIVLDGEFRLFGILTNTVGCIRIKRNQVPHNDTTLLSIFSQFTYRFFCWRNVHLAYLPLFRNLHKNSHFFWYC